MVVKIYRAVGFRWRLENLKELSVSQAAASGSPTGHPWGFDPLKVTSKFF